MIDETDKCIDFLNEKYGLDISLYDSVFLEKGIRNRMAVTASLTVAEYLLNLDILPTEYIEFQLQLSNSFSEFFRNPLTFAYIEQIVLPSLIGKKIKNNENEIRIWSAPLNA